MEIKSYQLNLLILISCTLILLTSFPTFVQSANDSSPPPQITILGNTNSTNITIVTFRNSSHIVVSKNISYIELKCLAAYPVMWSLASLEQPWVAGTKSERIVEDFQVPSTYKYSMSVKLNRISNSNNIPEEFVCHATDLSDNLVSRLVIIWEDKISPYLNTVRNAYVNSSYQVHWAPTNNGTPTSVLVPCYTLNVLETKVDLYRREKNLTLTYIDPVSNSQLRFEPYVGFFLSSSVIQSDNEIYECHAKRADAIELVTTTARPSNINGSLTEKPFSLNGLLKKLNSSSDLDWLDDLEYLYVEDLEDSLLENSTYDTLELHTTPGTKVPGSLSAIIFTLVKVNSSSELIQQSSKRPNQPADVLASYLNRTNGNLVISTGESYSYHITCCIKTGAFTNYSSDNILLHYKKCTEPLMCLTRNHVLKKTYIPYYSRDDSYYSPRCRSMSRSVTDSYNPNVYICHMRTDRKYSRSYYGGYFDPIEDYYDTSYLVQESNSSIYAQLEYQSVNDNNKKRQWFSASESVNYRGSNANVFYIGDTILFRCKASPFLYASGIIWETEWENGTSQIIPANHTTDSVGSSIAVYSIELVNDRLKKISCHLPPWNSTDWVTLPAPLTVRASSKPVTPSGESLVYENITFYTRKSATLHCNFDGHPPPKFTWFNSSSTVYTVENEGIKTYPYTEASQNTTVSTSYSWSYVINSTVTIPSQTISCSASNVAGNATKIFNVQAIRSFAPILSHSTREVIVLFLNDENSLLNCSITKGIPIPEFSWRKHGINISAFNNHETRTNDNESSLVFKKVQYEDEGEYTCSAINFVGSAMKEFTVRVRERPSSRYWYEIAVAILSLSLIAMFGFLAYVYITKTKKITRLEMRAEYSKTLGSHESRVTLATQIFDD